LQGGILQPVFSAALIHSASLHALLQKPTSLAAKAYNPALAPLLLQPYAGRRI
jgi:hypothetical protein